MEPEMREGHIYVLLNRAFRQDQFKVGKTARTPAVRAKELSAATGIPEPFEVLYDEHVRDCDEAERLVHERLKRYRVAGNKEFFRTTLRPVIDAIQEAAQKVGRIEGSESVHPNGRAARESGQMGDNTEVEIDIAAPKNPTGRPRIAEATGEKELLYFSFWKELLTRIGESTQRFDDVRPTAYYYIQPLSGTHSGVVFYLTLNESSLRAELFFNTGDSGRNKQLYDGVVRHRGEIDSQFPVAPVWRQGKTCGIKYTFAHGCYRLKEDWDALMVPALDSLLVFEKALKPYA